jgi:hypothetical protein
VVSTPGLKTVYVTPQIHRRIRHVQADISRETGRTRVSVSEALERVFAALDALPPAVDIVPWSDVEFP